MVRLNSPKSWDRVWETLLSERTLHAMLFLGATLLFAAAVSLVVWNWNAFLLSDPVYGDLLCPGLVRARTFGTARLR